MNKLDRRDFKTAIPQIEKALNETEVRVLENNKKLTETDEKVTDIKERLGYNPARIKMQLDNSYTGYPTSYNYFHPFYNEVSVLGKKGNLTIETRTLDYGDRTGARIRGIRIGADISAVQITASIRYLNNDTEITGVHTLLYYVPVGGSPRVMNVVADEYGNERFTQVINVIVTDLTEGDFLFIATYKAYTARDIDVIATNGSTHMSAIAIESGELGGEKGEDGVGIASIRQTSTSTEDGGTNIITATLTNGEVSNFTVRNGAKGTSPTIEVASISGGHKVSITDISGTQEIDIMDGKDAIITAITNAEINEICK